MPKLATLSPERKQKLLLAKLEDSSVRTWTCKIGFAIDRVSSSSDAAMRMAVTKAFMEITGHTPDFIFSGWGGKLDEAEKRVVLRERLMENPATWSNDTSAIQAAISEYYQNCDAGIIGHSMARIIEMRVVEPLRTELNKLQTNTDDNQDE